MGTGIDETELAVLYGVFKATRRSAQICGRVTKVFDLIFQGKTSKWVGLKAWGLTFHNQTVILYP
jgi:hypothetical protein